LYTKKNTHTHNVG